MSATGERPAPRPRPGEAGATLLEMLVVVALLSMISAVVFADFRPALRRAALDAAADQLASTLARARAAALRTSTPQEVEIAEDGGGYAYAGRRTALPAGARLEGGAGPVRFSANGASAAAALQLSGGGRRLVVAVAPAGGVSVGVHR